MTLYIRYICSKVETYASRHKSFFPNFFKKNIIAFPIGVVFSLLVLIL
jgi:hypothetical protein